MSTKYTTTMAPEALLIKLSAQQHSDFSACARTCGLDLVTWLIQCGDVQAAAAIDAVQALQRVPRPDRKKQLPRQQVSPKGPLTKRTDNTMNKSVTMKAARAFNENFRRRCDKQHEEQESSDEESR